MAKKQQRKRKKPLQNKINPSGSNKMIYAVGVGLAIIFIVFILVFMGGDSPINKKQIMESTMEYLVKSSGIVELKFMPEQNKIIIIYDENNEELNFQKIANYAGVRVSNKIGDEELTIALVGNKDKSGKENYHVVLKNGTIISTQRL